MVSFPHHDHGAPFSLDSQYSIPHHAFQSPETCKRCHVGCGDLKVLDCGCFLHARCTPIQENVPMTHCPICRTPVRSLELIAMSFHDIDAAKAAAASMALSVKRGKKRKNATIARLNPSSNSSVEEGADGSDLRTGRWTTEEALYCDKLIEKFETGELPIAEGIKLNDFLSNMLKSKQSRLTKKMKNARLSAKVYKRAVGYVASAEEASEFSELEVSFYSSIQCDMERSEIRFHMEKEWRELFSSYCVSMAQKLDADLWLSSVEEMDRRASKAKDAARMARRKVLMGYALSQDSMNPERGVFIERSTESKANGVLTSHDSTGSLAGMVSRGDKKPRTGHDSKKSLRSYSSPFVGKVIQYIHRHNIPFEHIDAWVPSFVPVSSEGAGGPAQASMTAGSGQKCRLCFAGFASTENQIPAEGGRPVPLGGQDQFDLLSFGEYSQKFSFDVGCGLPGRVYSSGICSWEQGVENAPSGQFERCGGASQWGIKTVLGVPIPSPNVGRVVVLLYSRYDRKRDPEMVRRIAEELTKLMPTPKWKLVVDVGVAPPPKSDSVDPLEYKVHDVLKLITDHAPANKNSPYAPYLPGFTSLRLLLIKPDRTAHENDLMTTMLDSYSSYLPTGRPPAELAWMIARDFMLLTQSPSQPSNTMGSSQAQGRPASNGTGGMIQQHGHQQQMPRHQQVVQQQLSGLSQHLAHGVGGMSAQQHMPPQQLSGALQTQHTGGILQQAGDQRHSAFHPLVQHHSSSQLAHHSGGQVGM